jgi:hypothetical protein
MAIVLNIIPTSFGKRYFHVIASNASSFIQLSDDAPDICDIPLFLP